MYVNLICLYGYKVNTNMLKFLIIVETCFQQLYNVIGFADSEYDVVTTCGQYVLLFTTKNLTNFDISQKRGFNDYLGEIEYID